MASLQQFSLFISYVVNPMTGEWRKLPPIPFIASGEAEASRTAIAIANFAVAAVSQEVLIRVVADNSNGQPIAEIRRPQE